MFKVFDKFVLLNSIKRLKNYQELVGPRVTMLVQVLIGTGMK